MYSTMEKGQELIDLRNQVEDIDGTVFFSGEDEDVIVKYKQSVIDKYTNDKEKASQRLRKQVVDRIYEPRGTPLSTLNELEDMAMDEGFDPDEIELILHSL